MKRVRVVALVVFAVVLLLGVALYSSIGTNKVEAQVLPESPMLYLHVEEVIFGLNELGQSNWEEPKTDGAGGIATGLKDNEQKGTLILVLRPDDDPMEFTVTGPAFMYVRDGTLFARGNLVQN